MLMSTLLVFFGRALLRLAATGTAVLLTLGINGNFYFIIEIHYFVQVEKVRHVSL